jgi:hypothetical protein
VTDIDPAAIRAARKDGSLRTLLRQQIAEGQARRLTAAAPKAWPVSGKRSDARGITCPHCGAGPDQRCQLRTRDKTLPHPHQQRIAAWAQLVACCPDCEAAPGTPCHRDGIALPNGTVHARRYQEAEETAA